VLSEAKGIANRVGREQRVSPLIRDEDVHAADLRLVAEGSVSSVVMAPTRRVVEVRFNV